MRFKEICRPVAVEVILKFMTMENSLRPRREEACKPKANWHDTFWRSEGWNNSIGFAFITQQTITILNKFA